MTRKYMGVFFSPADASTLKYTLDLKDTNSKEQTGGFFYRMNKSTSFPLGK